MCLETEFRQVLADMEVWLQYGSTSSFEPVTSSGERTYGRPSGDGRPVHLLWRERWVSASVFERPGVLEDARVELAGLLKQKRVVVVPETVTELEARVVREGEGWSVADTARYCRCTETFVRRARSRASAARVVVLGDRRERVLELVAQGLSERQINMITGAARGTIRRAMGKAA